MELTLLGLTEAVRKTEAKRAKVAERKAARAAKTVEAVAAEEVAPQLFSLTAGDGESTNFQRITAPNTLRDLNPMMHERMQQVCYFLAVTTPFGKRIVEILDGYTVGHGLRVTAKDPDVQEVLLKFWNDPVNNMDQTCHAWTNELTIFGELTTPAVRNLVDGTVRMGYVDPMKVEGIQFGELQTEQGGMPITMPVAVRLRRQVGEVEGKLLQIIRRDEDAASGNYASMQGQCFYFSINKVKSASRGFSELFSLADWIDVLDQMIFDFADKVRFLNAYIWHYIVQGADDKTVSKFRDDLTKNPVRQGGIQVTNDKVTIEAKTPDFKGADMAAGADMVKNYGIGGAGLPDWFFGDSGSGNRSTADEMNGPTGKKIGARQDHLISCVSEVLDFVIESAIEAGVLSPNVDRCFTIEAPPIGISDFKGGAETLNNGSVALAAGEDRGWIKGVTAARAFHILLSGIGLEIEDSAAEYEEAQQELQDRSSRQQNSLFPQKQLADALNQLQSGDATGADAVPTNGTEA